MASLPLVWVLCLLDRAVSGEVTKVSKFGAKIVRC